MNTDRKKLLLYGLLISLVVITFIALSIVSFRNATPESLTQTQTPTPKTIPSAEYRSPFAAILPGQTKTETLESIVGLPEGTEPRGNLNLMFFYSQVPTLYDYVWTQGDLVYATKEMMPDDFDEIKLDLNESSFIKTYGYPDLELYDAESEGSRWKVYLNRGLAIEVADKKVFSTIKFIPQNKQSFLSNTASNLGLTQKREPLGAPILESE